MLKRTMFSLTATVVTRLIIASCILLLLVLISSFAACSSPTSTPKPKQMPLGPIKAVWVEPQVANETVSIPLKEIDKNWNIHFKLGVEAVVINFMAYVVDEEIHIRANVCPPCWSIGYSLEKGVLICDTCRTTFKAKTGDGIKGACVAFPKASVPYEIRDGKIVMKKDALLAAYQNTLKPGWP